MNTIEPNENKWLVIVNPNAGKRKGEKDWPEISALLTGAGFEFVPEKYSNTSFLKRIEYRIGLNYGDNYLILDGVQLKEYGASTGFAVRMRPTSSLSKLTWYFQYTRREGDLAKGLPNEDIFTTGISLNLYDFWFIKKRYD